MYKFRTLEIENVVTHKKTKIEFKSGVNVIRGDNAVGKSTIMTALTKLATNDLPHSQRKSEKEIDGTARITFEKNGNTYDIKADFTKNKYSIIRNDKLIDYRKASDSRDAVAEILPWSIDAWQNFVYVSSDTFPILLKGRAVQRRAIFEDLFDIKTSIPKKKVQIRLDALDKEKLKLDTLRKSFDGSSYAEMRRLHKSILNAVKGLEADLERLNAELIGAEPAAQLWRDLCKDHSVLVDIDYDGLALLIKDVEESEFNLSMYAKMEKMVEALGILKELQKDTKNVNPKDILSDSDYVRYETIVENENGIIRAGNSKPVLQPNMGELTDAQNALDLLKSDQHIAKCPTCKQTVKNVEDLIKSYETIVRDGNRQYDDYAAYTKIKKYIDHFEQEHGFTLPLPKEIDVAKKALERHAVSTKHKTALERIQRLETFIAKKKEELGEWEPELEAWQYDAFYNIGKDAGPLLKNRLDYLAKKNKGSVRSEKEIRDDIHITKVSLNNNIDDLAIQKAHMQMWKQWYKQAVIYHVRNIDRKPLQALQDIYNKKLKIAATQHVLSHWIDEMNNAALFTYGEGYVFDARIDNAGGVSITCERKKDSRWLVSDVRRLSGYESKMFPLASLMAMAKILPEDLRTNILVLDEIESNMSAASRRRLVRLLPELQKVYDSIWIITPANQDEFPILLEEIPVREYRVEMKNGFSELRQV